MSGRSFLQTRAWTPIVLLDSQGPTRRRICRCCQKRISETRLAGPTWRRGRCFSVEAGEHVLDFTVDDFDGEGGYQGVVVEVQARHLLLESPCVDMDVEDSFAKKISEDGWKVFLLGEVLEISLEHVFHVLRVGIDRVPQHVDVDGFVRRVSKEVSVPVAEVVKGFRPTCMKWGMSNMFHKFKKSSFDETKARLWWWGRWRRVRRVYKENKGGWWRNAITEKR